MEQVLHKKLVDIGFKQSLMDMCVYSRWTNAQVLVLGVYVDDLLVTGTDQSAVDGLFGDLGSLSIKDLGRARKFLGMPISYDDDKGYTFNQEPGIVDMRKENGLELAHVKSTPIVGESGEVKYTGKLLPDTKHDSVVSPKSFQSLAGKLAMVFTMHETGYCIRLP